MGNMSKRQQPDHRTDNSRRSPTGLIKHMYFVSKLRLLVIFFTGSDKLLNKIPRGFQRNDTLFQTMNTK